MKKILLLLALVSNLAFGQLNRTQQLNNTVLQYAPANVATAKSVVIILPGIGEKGSDLTIIESHIAVAAALKAGTFAPNRIVLFAQLPTSQGGYYANTVGPVVTYAKQFNLPIDFSGLSLGGMGVGLNLPVYPGVFRSAMTCPGKVEANVTAGPTWPAIYYDSAYKKLPSIHYYDPADNTIANGYTSTKALVTKLQAAGKKDITLIELPGKGHNVWDYAYSAANYWAWLDALDTPVAPPTVKHLWLNDTVDMGPCTVTAINKIEVK